MSNSEKTVKVAAICAEKILVVWMIFSTLREFLWNSKFQHLKRSRHSEYILGVPIRAKKKAIFFQLQKT